jgi:hypothetical protein
VASCQITEHASLVSLRPERPLVTSIPPATLSLSSESERPMVAMAFPFHLKWFFSLASTLVLKLLTSVQPRSLGQMSSAPVNSVLLESSGMLPV